MIFIAALAAAQALSGMKQAEDIRMSQDLTNHLNEINARYAEYDAYEAKKFGDTEVARYQPNIDNTVAAQRAGYASEGVDVSFGTAAEVQQETKMTGALNIIDIQNQARMKALGFTQQARNLRQSGSVANAQADINAHSAEVSGILNAGATGYRGYTQSQFNSDGLRTGALGTSDRTG